MQTPKPPPLRLLERPPAGLAAAPRAAAPAPWLLQLWRRWTARPDRAR